MPRIIDYSPPWLARPSPGASFFSPSTKDKASTQPSRNINRQDSAAQSDMPQGRPKRILARRGKEVFAVVDNQIRWANLSTLKDDWKKGAKERMKESSRDKANGDPQHNGTDGILSRPGPREENGRTEEDTPDEDPMYYRVLVAPVYGQIEQLSISPNGAFLAIVTTYTIHIAVLLDSSHLSSPDSSPLRLKTYQLGPTTHVIPESPVVSAVWHPLGVCDNYEGCIVTVTADAAVRVWEIDTGDHWSFDRPALAVDLKKLIDGTSMDEDFAPLAFGQNKGFSADSVDMEVAAAKFGGHGYDDEDAWGAMTLWVAMSPGDIYALCPLLPSKWQGSRYTIPSLTASIVQKLSAAQDGDEPDDEVKAIQQQYEWLREIDNQDPSTEILLRPTNLSAIPRLQGPFQFDAEEMFDDLDLTDILVIPAKADVDDLISGEDEDTLFDGKSQGGLSGTIICLATSSGMVHICLEMDGVEGQWLPKTSTGTFSTPMPDPSELLLLESLETVRRKDQQLNSWPMFSEDVGSRYSFFLTTARNVTYFSLSSWVQRVEPELLSSDTAGSAFRVSIICDGAVAEREQILQLPSPDLVSDGNLEHLSSCFVIFDYDLGYLLLTYSPSQICAIILDSPEYGEYVPAKDLLPFDSELPNHQALIPAPRRSPYQVPSILYSLSPLTSFIEEHVPHGHRHTLKDPVRLSPSTLDLITVAHRILSVYTHNIEKAASDLFRRCERLQGEMRDQLNQLVEIGERVNDVSNGTVRGTQNRGQLPREQALDSRMSAVETKQKQLVERYNNIRMKVIKAGGRPMSGKERGWVEELEKLSGSIGQGDGEEEGELTQRLQTALSLARGLISEVGHTAEQSEPATPVPADRRSIQPMIPQRLQKSKVAEAMNMVERESAVIDGITSRLERLTTSVPEF